MRGLKKIFIASAAIALLYWAYGAFFGAPSGAGMQGGAMPVSVAKVIQRDVLQWQEFSGRLVAVDSADVRPQVSGVIDKVHFREGDLVQKGQPLFTIDQRPYAAALQAAQARATLAQSELARARKLLAEKAVPQREFDQSRNNAEVAQADLARARLDYEYTLVKAPVSGQVGRAEITQGNLVKASDAPLLTVVVANRPIYADFDIDEQAYLRLLRLAGSDIGKVRSIPVYVGLADEKDATHEGRMQSFDNRVNVRSGTLRARAVLANSDGSLVPGLYARVRLGSAAKTDALLITDRAVGTDQDRKFVIVVKDDNTTERREVKLGSLADGMRIVKEGLRAGEKIIISGMQRVMMPGQPVMPELEDMNAPGSAIREPRSEQKKPAEKADGKQLQ